jgi:hypothetical protein
MPVGKLKWTDSHQILSKSRGLSTYGRHEQACRCSPTALGLLCTGVGQERRVQWKNHSSLSPKEQRKAEGISHGRSRGRLGISFGLHNNKHPYLGLFGLLCEIGALRLAVMFICLFRFNVCMNLSDYDRPDLLLYNLSVHRK